MRAETAAVAGGGPARRDGIAGFTILEVLVALTVLGLVVAVLFQGIASGLRRTSYDESQLALVLEAQQVLQRIDLDLRGELPTQSGTNGELRWRLERTPIQEQPVRRRPIGAAREDQDADQVEEGQLLLVRYVVTVEDAEGRQLSVETKRLRTASASTAAREGPSFGSSGAGSEGASGFGSSGSESGFGSSGSGSSGFGSSRSGSSGFGSSGESGFSGDGDASP
jgi:prepilin-type N-terminal cleavage/methylation domain-containing protein